MQQSTQLILPSDADCAYAAGFFDGEGCVSIPTPDGKTRQTPQATVTISNTNHAVLEWFRARWGGRMWGSTPKPGDTRNPYWIWSLNEQDSRPFLEAVLPHLIVKAAVAENALEFIHAKAQKTAFRLSLELRARLLDIQRRHLSLQTRAWSPAGRKGKRPAA